MTALLIELMRLVFVTSSERHDSVNLCLQKTGKQLKEAEEAVLNPFFHPADLKESRLRRNVKYERRLEPHQSVK